MADERGSYDDEEVPMTAEEESAFASAQAATGMAMLHKPRAASRAMAAEVGGGTGYGYYPSSQRIVTEPSPNDSATRSKERRQRCGECHGCTRDDCGVCVSCQASTPSPRTRTRCAAAAHARAGRNPSPPPFHPTHPTRPPHTEQGQVWWLGHATQVLHPPHVEAALPSRRHRLALGRAAPALPPLRRRRMLGTGR